MGGGSLPGQTLPSFAIRFLPEAGEAKDIATRLRGADRPVIGRIQDGRMCLDMRTVLPDDAPLVSDVLQRFQSA